MLLLKAALVFFLALVVGADKKIELQDIEEDNLKSEKESDKSEARSQTTGQETTPLTASDFLKSGYFRYLDSSAQMPQQARYVHQYAVTEQPERPEPKPQYGPPASQHAMVGYLSNIPMQIYLVPQYYNEQTEEAAHAQPQVQYSPAQGVARVASYPTAPETEQSQTNYVEVPTYVTPTGKAYIQQYPPQFAYVTYASQPTAAPAHPTTGPVLYQMPIVHYPTAIAAPPVIQKGYYHQPQYTETNAIEDVQDDHESPKQYSTQTEAPFTKSPSQEFPRYYNSRTPIREDYTRYGPASELPPPNPLVLRNPPPHLAHLPKSLPSLYRPLTKPVYATGGNFISSAYTQRPSEAYGAPFKRRPTSLLDSYVPSSVQVEYLKRGYSKDPSALYEALSTGRQYSHHPSVPRHYERGFLPNQMYHTAAGGITYGHYKRTPKLEQIQKK